MGKLDLCVFASGRGSNFSALLEAIDDGRLKADVRLLVSNNPEAGALTLAKKYRIPAEIISRDSFSTRDQFVEKLLTTLNHYQVNFIVLAGYLKKIPKEVISDYRHHIVNIHPALLPAFGGKGMYGHHVHEAVLKAGCKVTGVTVHIIDEVYDHGPIVAQKCIPVENQDTPETLAARVLKYEHLMYWEVLQLFAEDRVQVRGQQVFIRV